MYHFLHHIVYLTSTLLICLLVALSSQMILFTAFANGRKMGKIPSVCCIDPPILHLNARLGGEALLSLSPRPITHLPQPKRPFSPISGGVSWCMFRHIHPLIQGFWDLSPPHAPHLSSLLSGLSLMRHNCFIRPLLFKKKEASTYNWMYVISC